MPMGPGNSDLIGRHYKIGEDGVLVYEVIGLDPDYPNVIVWRNVLTGAEGHSLVDFVRPFLIEETV